MYLNALPAALQAAGIQVRLYEGWDSRNHGPLTVPVSVVWHHDASAVGDSPTVPLSMIRRWNIAAAPIWVDRYGVWHFIGNGRAYHAGNVLPGKPGNSAVGIETDHTTGEEWPVALLDSLRRGTAVLLRMHSRAPDPALEFHKTVCRPPGRKIDPDGLDLYAERAAVAAIMSGGVTTPVPAPSYPHPTGELGVLGKGDKGDDVRQLQRQLLALGWPLPRFGADGDFGDETDAAVRDLQRAAGLDVDGLVGPATRAAIARGVRPTAPPPPPKPARRLGTFPLPAGHWFGPESSNRRNHSGYWAGDRPHIAALLNALRSRGWVNVPRTDRYTAAVAALVRRYQDDAEIGVDGLTGAQTWESIATSPVR